MLKITPEDRILVNRDGVDYQAPVSDLPPVQWDDIENKPEPPGKYGPRIKANEFNKEALLDKRYPKSVTQDFEVCEHFILKAIGTDDRIGCEHFGLSDDPVIYFVEDKENPGQLKIHPNPVVNTWLAAFSDNPGSFSKKKRSKYNRGEFVGEEREAGERRGRKSTKERVKELEAGTMAPPGWFKIKELPPEDQFTEFWACSDSSRGTLWYIEGSDFSFGAYTNTKSLCHFFERYYGCDAYTGGGFEYLNFRNAWSIGEMFRWAPMTSLTQEQVDAHNGNYPFLAEASFCFWEAKGECLDFSGWNFARAGNWEMYRADEADDWFDRFWGDDAINDVDRKLWPTINRTDLPTPETIDCESLQHFRITVDPDTSANSSWKKYTGLYWWRLDESHPWECVMDSESTIMGGNWQANYSLKISIDFPPNGAPDNWRGEGEYCVIGQIQTSTPWTYWDNGTTFEWLPLTKTYRKIDYSSFNLAYANWLIAESCEYAKIGPWALTADNYSYNQSVKSRLGEDAPCVHPPAYTPVMVYAEDMWYNTQWSDASQWVVSDAFNLQIYDGNYNGAYSGFDQTSDFGRMTRVPFEGVQEDDPEIENKPEPYVMYGPRIKASEFTKEALLDKRYPKSVTQDFEVCEHFILKSIDGKIYSDRFGWDMYQPVIIFVEDKENEGQLKIHPNEEVNPWLTLLADGPRVFSIPKEKKSKAERQTRPVKGLPSDGPKAGRKKLSREEAIKELSERREKRKSEAGAMAISEDMEPEFNIANLPVDEQFDEFWAVADASRAAMWGVEDVDFDFGPFTNTKNLFSFFERYISCDAYTGGGFEYLNFKNAFTIDEAFQCCTMENLTQDQVNAHNGDYPFMVSAMYCFWYAEKECPDFSGWNIGRACNYLISSQANGDGDRNQHNWFEEFWDSDPISNVPKEKWPTTNKSELPTPETIDSDSLFHWKITVDENIPTNEDWYKWIGMYWWRLDESQPWQHVTDMDWFRENYMWYNNEYHICVHDTRPPNGVASHWRGEGEWCCLNNQQSIFNWSWWDDGTTYEWLPLTKTDRKIDYNFFQQPSPDTGRKSWLLAESCKYAEVGVWGMFFENYCSEQSVKTNLEDDYGVPKTRIVHPPVYTPVAITGWDMWLGTEWNDVSQWVVNDTYDHFEGGDEAYEGPGWEDGNTNGYMSRVPFESGSGSGGGSSMPLDLRTLPALN